MTCDVDDDDDDDDDDMFYDSTSRNIKVRSHNKLSEPLKTRHMKL